MSLDMFMYKCDMRTYFDVYLDRGDLINMCQRALDTDNCDCAEDYNLVFIQYWSTANQLYRWFVNHTDVEREHPGPYCIKRDELSLLKNTCGKVIELGVNEYGEPVAAICEKLLPTLDGPCFGDTSYDENYLCEVQLTFNFLCELLEKTNWDEEVILLYADW